MKTKIIMLIIIVSLLNIILVSSLSVNINSPFDNSFYNNQNILFNITNPNTENVTMIFNLDNSLVSWWRMDDVNQTGLGAKVYDYMSVNNGTAVGQANQTNAGKFGKGFQFDGSGDYVTTPLSLSMANNFSVSAWIYPTSAGWKTYVGSDTATYYPYLISTHQPDEKLMIGYKNTSAGYPVSSVFYNYVNKWNHIVLVKNDTYMVLYADGNIVTSLAVINPDTTAFGIDMGASGNGASRFANGSIDDVLIFNRSLSASEIVALYNATAINYQTNLGLGNHTLKVYVQNYSADISTSSISFNVNNNCWNKINRITFIPRGCSYFLNRGSVFQI